jgi:lipid-A-disaccharide synthase
MEAAGVELVAGMTHAMGISETLTLLPRIKRSFDSVVAALRRERPALVVLIDYPDFNFRLGARAKAMGCKVLYYVSPQVWAWRPGRVHTMKRFVDRMAVLLPFEADIYRKVGIPCEFVGHPVLDDMSTHTEDRAEAARVMGLDPAKRYVALLPGSRATELTRLLPVLADVAREIRAKYPSHEILVSVAPNVDVARFQELFGALEDSGCRLVRHNIALLYTLADASVVASGTAAFQAVFRSAPIVVIYKTSRFSEFVIRMLAKVSYVNLANLILGREAVRELLQELCTPANIMRELEPLLDLGSARRSCVVADLTSVRRMFEGKDPSRRVAAMIAEMLAW